jgi:NAD(P)-dependent dehydrogenase (short-subunit alcohol dehydrogenase family)
MSQVSFPRAFDLTGDAAVVSGAGSRVKGIIIHIAGSWKRILTYLGEIGNGRACAILLARQGAKVALLDFNEQWAQDTKEMIDTEGGVSEVFQVDVTDEASVEKTMQKTVDVFGRLDILVNIGMSPAWMDQKIRLLIYFACSRCWRCNGRRH